MCDVVIGSNFKVLGRPERSIGEMELDLERVGLEHLSRKSVGAETEVDTTADQLGIAPERRCVGQEDRVGGKRGAVLIDCDQLHCALLTQFADVKVTPGFHDRLCVREVAGERCGKSGSQP